MTHFTIIQMPSRKARKDLIGFYVKDVEINKTITKFNNNIERAEDIPEWINFTSSKKLELMNFLSNIHFFSKKLNLSAKLNKSYRLSLPKPLQDAMIELFEKSQQHGIEFNPIHAMLDGLMKHIMSVEKNISALKEYPILEKYGIHAYSPDEDKITSDDK